MDYDTNLILQKALSLYIDNGMFAKNRLALQRHLQYNQAQSQKLLTKSNLNLSYQLLNQQAIIRLNSKQDLAPLKKAKLKVDLLEENYIGRSPQDYLRLTGREELEDFINRLSTNKEGRT